MELRANVLNYLHLDLDDGEQFGNHLAIRRKKSKAGPDRHATPWPKLWPKLPKTALCGGTNVDPQKDPEARGLRAQHAWTALSTTSSMTGGWVL